MKEFGHPAMFPEEIPYRLMRLFTYRGDIVVGPLQRGRHQYGGRLPAAAAVHRDRHLPGVLPDGLRAGLSGGGTEAAV